MTYADNYRHNYSALLMPVVFRVKLGKTGNSLKITLPKPIIDGFEFKEGDEIEIRVSDFDIVLTRGGNHGAHKRHEAPGPAARADAPKDPI